MRLCRYRYQDGVHVGFYDEKYVVPIAAGATAYTDATHEKLTLTAKDDLLEYLPPDGKSFEAVKKLAAWANRQQMSGLPDAARIQTSKVELLVPLPRPNKLFLLAGNYNEHIQEGGGAATERAETFPYVFMKPPTTTLADPGQAVVIPQVSPQHVDWELELAVVIGRRGKHIPETEALKYVAGYTVIND